ncbi:MAG: methyltransferase domain-containing protein [Candidatus Omnitrophota bacterium]|nr:MAG: methyltransferase domain-containing protein [Candidatus Omnitrophota bacterium]
MKILEIGPDGVPSTYEKVIDNDTIAWETLDIVKSKKVTYIAENEYKFPIPDNTFDIVLSGQVIEHVKKYGFGLKNLLGYARQEVVL